MVGKQSNPFELGENHSFETLPDTPRGQTDTPIPAVEKLAQPQRSWRSAPQSRAWKLWLAALGGCCVFGGVGAAAFWWLTTPPPSPDCRQLSPLATDMEQLLCAQQSARSGDLPKILAGLELVGQWSPDHPLYREAQRLIAAWSDPVLSAARERIERSDLQGAIELANRIPKTSSSYKDAQAAIAEWNRDWQKGEAIAAAARKAMQEQNWVLANEKIAVLQDFPQDHWRYQRATALSQLVLAEQRGRQVLMQARTLATGAQATQLGAAIGLLSQINRQTYAWMDAQKPLQQWSEILLTQGWQFWQQGKLDDAMAVTTPVLQNPALATTAQELLWLSQARKHALASTTTLKPTLPQLWNLSAAIATVDRIPPTSRYASQSQALLQNWQAQLQDLSLLQVAWSVGEISLPLSQQMALWQAAQVGPERPRRAQAQTLLSYWKVGIRRLQDQPYLAYARQLAAKGTISAFQAAIAQAQLISANRPRRTEAQTLIASWMQQIQTIEDQPILNQAWTLANQGNLTRAIQMASSIAPRRALYGQAQAAIEGWQASIRATEVARVREREAARQRSRPRLYAPPDSASEYNPNAPYSSDPFPPPADPSVISPPSSEYPPGTEPPPAQIPVAPQPAPPIYEPPPPPVQPAPPPYYQPYEPPPPPSR